MRFVVTLVLCLSGIQLSNSWSLNKDSVEEDNPEYKHIGCFKDTLFRALPDFLGSFHKNIAIHKCALLAKERGFTTFSVQYGGQCYSGATASKTYNKYGGAPNCQGGLGGTWANDVYSLPVTTEYERIGCFKDTHTRALPDFLGSFNKHVAIHKCAQLTKERSFDTFSVQYGGQCFTGATASKTYNKYGPAHNCHDGVGGTWANDVYSLLVKPEYNHIGCFKDTHTRALPAYLGTFNQNIAIHECAQLAKERGFITFSVQYGGQCYSGATASNTYNKYGPAHNCEKGLGGTWANDVYAFTPGFRPLDCFKDSLSDRALPDHLGNFEAKNLVEKCFEAAEAKGYKVFGTQNEVECWSGAHGKDTYNKHGKANNCVSGIGRALSNFVYEMY